MVFGRKKKQEHEKEVLDEEAPPSDGVEMDDDSSDGGSVPPPPPDVTSTSDMFRDEPSHSVDGQGNIQGDDREKTGISFLTDSTDGDENDPKKHNSHRGKKSLLFFLFIATLAALIGVTVSYARKPSSETAVSSSQANVSPEDGFFDADGEPVTVAPANSPVMTPGEETMPPTEVGTEESTEQGTADPTNASTDGVTDAATDAVTDGVTDAATDASTDGGTDAGTDAPTDGGTDAGTDAGTEEDTTTVGPGEFDCVVNQMFASSRCSGGTTSATITICILDAIQDQFWRLLSSPAGYDGADEWGWLSDGMTIQMQDIPAGRYEIGLFAGGDEDLDEYPLITSTSFQVICSP
ncbi:hypothetical protein IV203_008886 [Nitzschia inconspicua]|uniref:Uncharacterized protein n=1 Tax=Nitzschia inconspicua TaxID=303405 RepID=A0A9K3KZJ0_9STRA|nr:hypothetical protein IV203_008886 [Nitzschia inconspicua]